jgi:D-alanyl-D-alanine carboxypeptidase/D-alanyl-D-alanine-endopeptidase (penicillin-binding protein 4)
MKRSLLLFLVALAFFPAATSGGDSAHTIDAAIAKIGKEARVSVLIKSVTTGEVLYEKDAEAARAPASTMKLATTATALTLLGPSYEHETGVYAVGTLAADGTLKGNLVIKGSGDPSISRRFLIDDAKPLLADWAAELAKKVRIVEGDLVADDRAFERNGFHPDWNPNEAEEWYAAPVSALNLNDNCVDIEVGPGDDGPKVVARPETTAIALDVSAQMTRTKAEHKFACSRDPEGKTYKVSGKVWTKASPQEVNVTVVQPALFFASVLADRLREAGIKLEGKPRLVSEGEAPVKGTPLLVRRNGLPRALAVCNKRSQNLYAECLLKTLGHEKGALGSWDEGAKVVEKFLSDLKVDPAQVKVRDGSGLSRENRLSAKALETVLESVAKGPNFQVFDESLSIAGTDGTLEKRLKDLKGASFHGKTGTMHGVSALAGYLELEHGKNGVKEQIALVFLVNGTNGAALAREAQDDAVRITVRNRSTRP